MFERWSEGKVDARCQPATRIPLLVLRVLRYLGLEWKFDDLSENTGTSDEIIRGFFHKFIQSGVMFSIRNMWLLQQPQKKLQSILNNTEMLVCLAG